MKMMFWIFICIHRSVQFWYAQFVREKYFLRGTNCPPKKYFTYTNYLTDGHCVWPVCTDPYIPYFSSPGLQTLAEIVLFFNKWSHNMYDLKTSFQKWQLPNHTKTRKIKRRHDFLARVIAIKCDYKMNLLKTLLIFHKSPLLL